MIEGKLIRVGTSKLVPGFWGASPHLAGVELARAEINC
jgi:hypothetical protein